MKKYFFALIFIISNVFAFVPVTDVYQQTTDIDTIGSYASGIIEYLDDIGNTMNAAEQVENLKGLALLTNAGGTQLCALCNQSDLAKLNQYNNDISNDLCLQFSKAISNITGAKKSILTLQKIISFFKINPKAAALALQQASIATQTATQNTLAQMQMLGIQAQQHQLAKEKLERASTVAALNGFHSGL
jgi:hypothetical protein